MTLEVKNRRESDIYRSKFRSKNELEGKAQWLKIPKNVSFKFFNFGPFPTIFKNSPIFGIFDDFLFTQIVNVARFARNIE